jgi:hypothetical protein
MQPRLFSVTFVTAMKMDVRSTLDCGGSTPLWNYAWEDAKSGVEPPQSKVLRTSHEQW